MKNMSEDATMVFNTVKHDVATGMTRAFRRARITNSEVARKMKTSRALVLRTVHPKYESFSLRLRTLVKMASAANARVSIKLPRASRQTWRPAAR